MATLNVNIADFTTTPLESVRVTLTPLYDYSIAGNFIIAGDTLAKTSNASGSATFENVVSGNYTLGIFGPYKSTTATIAVTGNGGVNAKDLVTASVYTPENEFAYTRAQSDARFAPIGAISSGGSVSNVVYATGNQTVSGIKTFASQILASNGIANPNGYWSIDGGNATFSGNLSASQVTANQIQAKRVSDPDDGSFYFDISQGQIVRNNIAIIDAEQTTLSDGNGDAILDWSNKQLFGQWRAPSLWHPDEISWLIEANGQGTFSKLITRDGDAADGGLFIQNPNSTDIRLGNESFNSVLTVNAPIKVQSAAQLGYDSEFGLSYLYDSNAGGGLYFFGQGIAIGTDNQNFGTNVLTIPVSNDRVDINGTLSTSIGVIGTNQIINFSTTLISGANVTGTLPSSPHNGVQYTIKMASNTTGVIKAAGNFTIDGVNSRVLSGQYRYMTVQALANNWYVIAQG